MRRRCQTWKAVLSDFDLAFRARFVEALNEVAEAGRARNAARSMPERLKTVIDCGGYATRW